MGFNEIIHGEEITGYPVMDVKDLGAADWCLSLIARCEKHIAEVKALKADYLKKLDLWEEKELKSYYQTVENMTESLRPWIEDYVKNSKKKSISLVNGTVGLRKSPDRVEVEDIEKVPEEFTVIKKQADKKAIMAHLKKTGELADGCNFIPGGEKVSIKVDYGL